MSKVRHREFKWLIQGFPASDGRSWNWNLVFRAISLFTKAGASYFDYSQVLKILLNDHLFNLFLRLIFPSLVSVWRDFFVHDHLNHRTGKAIRDSGVHIVECFKYVCMAWQERWNCSF